MKKHIRAFAAAGGLLIAMSAPDAALAQKSGGILKMYIWDNPPSMSMLDGVNPLAQRATMGVFNNLIMFDQHVKQSSLESIVPDLATGWSWNEEGTALTLPLRQGVKWHDGKPFTAKDVQCTWDLLLERSSDKLRVNPGKSWYRNLEEVSTNGEYEVTFHLRRPQPAFPMLLASGFAPILSLSCAGTRHAAAPDWHRPVRIRRVQAERVDQSGPKPRLLEEGSALSRRHRIYHHPEYVDGNIGVHLRLVRHDLPVHPHGAAFEGCEEPEAGRNLRADAERRRK